MQLHPEKEGESWKLQVITPWGLRHMFQFHMKTARVRRPRCVTLSKSRASLGLSLLFSPGRDWSRTSRDPCFQPDILGTPARG